MRTVCSIVLTVRADEKLDGVVRHERPDDPDDSPEDPVVFTIAAVVLRAWRVDAAETWPSHSLGRSWLSIG